MNFVWETPEETDLAIAQRLAADSGNAAAYHSFS